jgi:predicted nucleotidyltransferase
MSPINFEDVVNRMAKALNPEQIILFGSRARGDHRNDSDYDVLIVVPDTTESTIKLAGDALIAARGKRFGMDVVVYTHSEFENSLRERHDVVYHAMQDGRVVYEKSHT